jgi:hypothetical protein
MPAQGVCKSETYDHCNCAVQGGCQFNLPSTPGYCQTALVGNIVEGDCNDTPRADRQWAGLSQWPGEIKAGNGTRQLALDDRADEAQRRALETILSGEACPPRRHFFSVFASTGSDVCQTLSLPSHLEANQARRTATVDIPGVMQSSGRPLINEFTGAPFPIALARPRGSCEFPSAEIGRGTTLVTRARERASEASWAHWCLPHFHQKGLIR